jgi:hypothetical protein
VWVRPTGLSGGPHDISGKSRVHVRGACGRMSGCNILAYNNDKRRRCLALYRDRLNNSNLFPVSRLDSFRVTTPFYAYNNYTACNNAYYKAYLIKVIDIIRSDTILRDYIRYKSKPRVYSD